MKVLVTGGAGFIGHHLVRSLVSRGDDVVVLDDFSSGRRERLADVAVTRVIDADICSGPGLAEAMAGREVVFHLAASASVVASILDPAATNDVNVGGTIRVAGEARRAGVRRVVLASSAAVYGARPLLPSRETDRPDPQSPYATSKLAAEHYLHNLGASGELETVALRYFNVFGPGQDPNAEYAAVVPRFIIGALGLDQIVVHGNGKQSRDFIHVDDVVAANLAAAEAPDAAGLTANVGSGQRLSLLDLLEAIGDAIGRPLDPVFAETRPGDVRDSQADVTLAAERLGWTPDTDFGAAIRRTLAWYQSRSTAERTVA